MRLYPDAVNQYLDDPTSGAKSKASRVSYKGTLRALQRAHPNHQVADFTENELIDYCLRPGLAPATIAGYRTRFVGFFAWAKWRGLITVDPAENLGRYVKGSLTQPVRQHHWLDSHQVTQVFDSIDTTTPQGLRQMVIARLGFTCGLRRQEIADLTWNQVDLDNQQIHLKGKGDKLASVYITDTTLPYLRQLHARARADLGRPPVTEGVIPVFNNWADFNSGYHLDVEWGNPASTDVIASTVRQVSEQAGVKFAAHDMRRSFANMLEKQGVRIEDISAALRHSNLGTTQRYLERRQDAAYKAVKGAGLNV